MLRVKAKQSTGNFNLEIASTRYSFICAACGKEIVFFYSSPPNCNDCGNKLMDVDKLLTDSEIKKRWHRKKLIISLGE